MNKAKITPEQRRVVSWLSTPKDRRDPKTITDLAQELGVKPSTISRWRTDLDLDTHAAQEIRRRLLERLPEVYDSLVTKAAEGSPEHIELLLKVTAGHSDMSEVTADKRRLRLHEHLVDFLAEDDG